MSQKFIQEHQMIEYRLTCESVRWRGESMQSSSWDAAIRNMSEKSSKSSVNCRFSLEFSDGYTSDTTSIEKEQFISEYNEKYWIMLCENDKVWILSKIERDPWFEQPDVERGAWEIRPKISCKSINISSYASLFSIFCAEMVVIGYICSMDAFISRENNRW